MILLKLYFHINALLILVFYKLIYRNQLKVDKSFTFRRGFSLVIDMSHSILDRNKPSGGVKIGKNVFFNNYCSINCRTSIVIGEGTIFGENVRIYDHNHKYADVMTPIKKSGYKEAPIQIGSHCWIASNVVVLKGVKIGDNCVIGAGCIVYKDVPSNTVLVNRQDLIEKTI